MTAFIGIDAGTQGVTVAIFDETGSELASADEDYPSHHPRPGWAEQSMEDVWQGLCRAAHRARREADIPDSAIRSVGLSSQRGTFVLLDSQKIPLAPAILWNDSRARHMEEALATKIDRTRYREITGMPLSGSWALAKLAWLRQHRPDLLDQTALIANGQEYLLHRLGADAFESDPASLTLNGMLDIRRLDWSEEVCAAAGITHDLLPPVGPPASQVGVLSPAAAEATGLPAGTPLCKGAGDQQCAAIGAGVISQGLAEMTVGTSAMMVAHLDDPDLVTGPSPYIGGHGIPGLWDAEGGAFSIGSALNWWRAQLGLADSPAGGNSESGWEAFMDLAAAAPAGSKGIIFHPFFAGQVTPYYDAAARGGFRGLSLHHDRTCLTRAVLEGCAFEMRLMVDALNSDISGGITDLRITGGGTKSALFRQIQADVIGRPLALPAYGECTVLGAAMLGAVGATAFDAVPAAVENMVRIDQVVEPRQEAQELYGELYELFRSSYENETRSGITEYLYAFQTRHG